MNSSESIRTFKRTLYPNTTLFPAPRFHAVNYMMEKTPGEASYVTLIIDNAMGDIAAAEIGACQSEKNASDYFKLDEINQEEFDNAFSLALNTIADKCFFNLPIHF